MARPGPAALGAACPGIGVGGCPVEVRVHWIIDPADPHFVAEGIGVPGGQRTVIVGSELVNRSPGEYSAPADRGLVLVDTAGNRHHRATATLTAYPRFRHGPLAPGEGAGGHTYFVLPRAAGLAVVEWSATGDMDEELLTWRVG